MNREDIIRMAREAGYGTSWYQVGGETAQEEIWGGVFETNKAIRFANLVAAAEREECAKVCDELEAGLRKTAMKQHQDYLDGNRRGISECAFAIRERGAP